MSTTGSWTCAVCLQEISKVEDGWVECLGTLDRDAEEPHYRYRGLQLVHHQPASPRREYGSCQYSQNRTGEVLCDWPLNKFVGEDGLMFIFGMLATGHWEKQEVLELAKRLHIPGYEQARAYFGEAISQEIIEADDAVPQYFPQEDIRTVLAYAKENPH